MNTRWDRSIFDHCYNWERGSGPAADVRLPRHPARSVGTRPGGSTASTTPSLPSPDSNSGNLPAGYGLHKYNWSLYHHENPMFGHFGHGFGVWFTPLGGVTDETLCAFYGVGPQHQDLAIHQDALILNYFSRNHYGEPAYPIPAGYRRLYGPWLTFFTTGDPDEPDAMIAQARARRPAPRSPRTAPAIAWVSDPLYPSPGRADHRHRPRPAHRRPTCGELPCDPVARRPVADVFPIAEPTYFVRTDADGRFTCPASRPPGSRAPPSPARTPSTSSARRRLGHRPLHPDRRRRRGAATRISATSPGHRPRHGTFLWQIGTVRPHRRRVRAGRALSPARPSPASTKSRR